MNGAHLRRSSWHAHLPEDPAISANLNSPIGVVTDSQGNLFISDFQNNRVRRVDATAGC